MTIKEWCDTAWANANAHGFKEDDLPLKIALMHSELSEALEEWRAGRVSTWFSGDQRKPEGLPIELADLAIRLFSYCGANGIDLERSIQLKHDYNVTRPYKHGGKRA